MKSHGHSYPSNLMQLVTAVRSEVLNQSNGNSSKPEAKIIVEQILAENLANEAKLTERIVNEILNNRCAAAEELILQTSNNTKIIPNIVQRVYGDSDLGKKVDFVSLRFDGDLEKKTDLILKCVTAFNRIDVSFLVLKSLRNEIETYGHSNPHNLMQLVNSLQKEVLSQSKNSYSKPGAINLVDEILFDIGEKILKILKTAMLANYYRENLEVKNLAEIIYSFNINLSDRIMKLLVNETFGQMSSVEMADNIYHIYHGSLIIPQIVTGLLALFERHEITKDMNNEALIRIAKYIKLLRNMSNYHRLSKKKKIAVNSLINRLPICAKNLFFAEEICIWNRNKQEYLYASDSQFYFSRRSVFANSIDKMEDDAIWKVEAEDHLREILTASFAGQGLLAFYKKHNKLEKENRKILVNTIVEFFYDSTKDIYNAPGSKHLDKIADQIVELFPTEKKDIYFIARQPHEKPNPSGLLFNRFNNINRNKRKRPVDQTLDTKILKVDTEEFKPEIQNVSLKNKMKIMQNYEDEALEYWKKTYAYRRSEILKLKNISEIFEEYPFFKQAGGEKFIDFDFETLYPSHQFDLINIWSEIEKSLNTFYGKHIKDKQYKLLYEKLSFKDIDKNSKDCIMVMLLNTVLKPTFDVATSRITIKNQASTSVKKTTISDAINSCIVHIHTLNDLQRTREEKLKFYMETKGTIQPYMIVIGEDITKLAEFYVVIGESILKFTSFIAAFDICFKAFHVFELCYPKESQLLWLFVQKFIFKIKTVHDFKSSVLSEFLETFKNY
ncbi:uncharacterized protein LOC129919193 [Episyrphus balteatus]|uniref:uncharacterized protein LOC129919193 n=1 Tax=Episyrphus balteatus TaxID=286459 RepID=UPI00248569A8|nr:uncharacterized protein LOC129919193 [Episyrphus balteatus]